MFSHITIGIQDLTRAVSFYDAALAPLGIQRVQGTKYSGWASWQRPGQAETLWVGKPQNGQSASHGNGWMAALPRCGRCSLRRRHGGWWHGRRCAWTAPTVFRGLLRRVRAGPRWKQNAFRDARKLVPAEGPPMLWLA